MCDLEISFYPVKVLDAPGWLLSDINFYRNHYRLGYSRTLGKSKEYWLKTLPRQLENGIDNPDELRRVIHELKENAKGDDTRKMNVSQTLLHDWRNIETVINSQLMVALTLFPSAVRSGIFNHLFPDLPQNTSTEIKTAGVKPNYIEPDLFAQLDNSLMMIELKVKAKYEIKQHLSYLRFISAYRQIYGNNGFSNVFHLILQPAPDLSRINNSDNWINAYNQETGILDISSHALKEYWSNNHTYLKSGPNFDDGELGKLSNDLAVYLKTWRQLAEAVDHSVNNIDLGEGQETIELLAQQVWQMCEHASGNYW